MITIAVIATILLVAGITIFIVITNAKRTERNKYYAAADSIIKEEFLNYSLKNTIGTAEEFPQPNSKRIMLYLKSVHVKPKMQYVFDPETIIYIGRDNEKSNIFINEAFVSQFHCRIFSNFFNVYIQDTNSSNGTIVQRGLFKKYFLSDGAVMELKTGDKILIGSNIFKIVLFYYDCNLM